MFCQVEACFKYPGQYFLFLSFFSFLLVGGTNDVTDVDSSSILEFDPANESWIVREERLEMGRLYPTAVLINENAGVTECYDQ